MAKKRVIRHLKKTLRFRLMGKVYRLDLSFKLGIDDDLTYDERKALVMSLYKTGKSIEDIALAARCCPQTVRRIIDWEMRAK